MHAFDIMQMNYQQRDFAAKNWKASGGKVVGYFSNDVPEELILAAGLFPLRVSGNPSSNTDQADKYIEPYYEPDVRTMFNMILTGRYDFLDYLIIPHSRDSILTLYYELSDIKRNNPALKLPELYLYDTLRTRYYQTGLYMRDRLKELKTKLEEWTGKELSTDALKKAVSITNENRTLLKKIAALRAAEPPRTSGVEALQIIGSSMFMMKEEHNQLLKEYLNGADKLTVRNGARLFVISSPLDNLQLYEVAESVNATIVGEDSCWGNRYSDSPIDQTIEVQEAIADRYHLKSPSPQLASIEDRVKYCLQSVTEAKAQAVIFYFLEWDNAPAWEYPDIKKGLDAKGINSLCFNMQKYLLSDNEKKQINIDIGKLIEAL